MTTRGKRQGGYFYLAALRNSDLPQIARHLAHVIAAVAKTETGRVRVSAPLLARWSGMSESSVHRQAKVLRAAGFLDVEMATVAEQMAGKPNTYVCVIPPGFPTSRLDTPSPAGTPSQSGRGVTLSHRGSPPLPYVTKPPPSGGPITTRTTGGAGSGSASAPARHHYGPLAWAARGVATACVCGLLFRESEPDGPCSSCGAIDAMQYVELDPKDHPWEPLASEDDPTCAICSKPHEEES